MSVAERPALTPPPAPQRAADTERRWPWLAGLALVLVVALGLRVWGVGQGMPFAYNTDENAHFVPNAIGLFGHGWNPYYFVNPPAYTYLLHVVFAAWFGGRAGVSNAMATNPTEVRPSWSPYSNVVAWSSLIAIGRRRTFHSPKEKRIGMLTRSEDRRS